MSFRNVRYLKTIVAVAVALALCAPLAAQEPEGKTYEVTVSVVTPGGTFPVACTCLTFDASPPACLRSPDGLLALWT